MVQLDLFSADGFYRYWFADGAQNDQIELRVDRR